MAIHFSFKVYGDVGLEDGINPAEEPSQFDFALDLFLRWWCYMLKQIDVQVVKLNGLILNFYPGMYIWFIVYHHLGFPEDHMKNYYTLIIKLN